MKRLALIFLMFLCVFNLASCSNTNENKEGSNITPTSNAATNISEVQQTIDNIKADNYYREEFITSYNEAFANAVNENDFTLIKDYLDKNSDVYKAEEKAVKEYSSKGINLHLAYAIADDIKNTSENVFIIKASVRYEIKNGDGHTKAETFKKVYTVLGKGETYKIMNIEENK